MRSPFLAKFEVWQFVPIYWYRTVKGYIKGDRGPSFGGHLFWGNRGPSCYGVKLRPTSEKKCLDITIVLTSCQLQGIHYHSQVHSTKIMFESSRYLACLQEFLLEIQLMSHQKTRHTANAYLQETAENYGIELSGTIPNCVSCSIKKIRQKNIPKENANKSTIPGD